jgi:hypothetical protein
MWEGAVVGENNGRVSAGRCAISGWVVCCSKMLVMWWGCSHWVSVVGDSGDAIDGSRRVYTKPWASSMDLLIDHSVVQHSD